ncbi:RNA polymerase sigma factor [Sinisalibacter aestuarii]|uniref:RNA polymerase sigma factor n=1 Tax=Sinisalibacter aestuarii TaxID=2949426 RepID=A0ABQ5LRX7_9RHOB|nr:RNA polymerase sigma factor [Sinisalibacter aestuarii]GKY87762.1 RNA polymerase sigma factor [Sinisalibacter aestuarii]
MTPTTRSKTPAPEICPATPEADLVAAARPGPEDARREAAVRELVRRLNPRLFRVARGIVESDAEAEEVVQEAYLAAFGKIDQFRGEAAFATWITRIAINAARMQQRRAHAQESYDTVAEERADPANVLSFPRVGSEQPETALGRAQMRALMERAVTALPSDMRLPFLLHEVEGVPVRQIAADLSLNPITVKTRLFRARRRLRASLEAELRGGFDTVFPFEGARCAGMTERVVNALRETGKL